jgi:hypothetical protein
MNIDTFPLDGSSAKIELGVVSVRLLTCSEARGMSFSDVGA